MSASSKKKLRNELEAAKLTERQLAEQKEAKKTKLYTIGFVVVLVALIAIAVIVGVSQTLTNSGVREKNTTALTVNGTDLSNADLNYFYIDELNAFYSENGSYAALFGLDVTLPLNKQVMDEETGETWADHFLSAAKSSATAVYSVCDAAAEAGHTLSEEELATVDSTMNTLGMYGTIYGYGDAEGYLKAMYGHGATEEGYRSYMEKCILAESFQNVYAESLNFEDADLRAAEADNYNQYSSYTYNYYYLGSTLFLEGGTTDENGNTTYSDEEKAASIVAAEEAANSLIAQNITSVEELDAAIAALPINADNDTASSTHFEDQPYNNLSATIAEWLTESGRKEGDIACLKNSSTADDGTENIYGYYIVYFGGSNDNNFALKNARHILVSFEGGTTDATGVTTYSDEEKAAAKAAAEEILAEYEAAPSESAFATLATLRSTDTGSTENGGLYEDIYPGQMVTAFEEWCYDESRKAGDTGIVETEYGYHVMYFVGDSDITYRDYKISNDLTVDAVSEWYTNIVNAATVTEGNPEYMSLDMVIGG
ncbi:MAG: peptidylprolyl isomerase [Oscillospiraceae bacterium]|nr:peptidylprolyl isomerase [Oscillospiraceae bacterium]MBQ7129582.1 peptidylprolyl isomerase [Oscillospiraceae bacterium]